MNYLDTDMSVKQATPKWYTPYVKGHPMIKLGEFCKTHGIAIESEYSTYPDVTTFYFRRYSMLGKAAASYRIPCDGINEYYDTSHIEDMIIKQIRDDFDIKEELQYMTTPINSERYKAIMNARYGICNNKPEIKNVIFSTLSSYAAEHYNITVEKEELIRAIQLIRMSREYGPSIGERWATATQNAAELDRAYNKGLQDGIQEARKRLENTFKEEKK